MDDPPEMEYLSFGDGIAQRAATLERSCGPTWAGLIAATDGQLEPVVGISDTVFHRALCEQAISPPFSFAWNALVSPASKWEEEPPLVILDVRYEVEGQEDTIVAFELPRFRPIVAMAIIVRRVVLSVEGDTPEGERVAGRPMRMDEGGARQAYDALAFAERRLPPEHRKL